MNDPSIAGLNDAVWSGLLAETVEYVVRRLARTRPGWDDSDDVGSEVARRLLRYRRSAMTCAAFRAVAWKIACNCSVDRHRAVQRAEQHAKGEAAVQVEDRSYDPVETREQGDHLKSVLLDILTTIPLESRVMLWMRFMDGATYEQIASTQNSSATTVRRRIEEALKHLDAALRSCQVGDRLLQEILQSIGITV